MSNDPSTSEGGMPGTAPFDRVIVVVLDGLRPDAIPRFQLDRITALARRGRSTLLARTVSPSVTSAAMASLLTGATPERHGLRSSRFYIPRPTGALHPLPRLLATKGLPTSIFLATPPFGFSTIARRIAAHLGFTVVGFADQHAAAILDAAEHTLRAQDQGLIVIHWPDADRAGHASGWMSAPYASAARALDVAFGRLVSSIDLDRDHRTLLIALADHGGGGALADQHESEHPLDVTIPLILAHSRIVPGDLGTGHSLLDVPATICAALGLGIPESFGGRPLGLFMGTDASLEEAA